MEEPLNLTSARSTRTRSSAYGKAKPQLRIFSCLLAMSLSAMLANAQIAGDRSQGNGGTTGTDFSALPDAPTREAALESPDQAIGAATQSQVGNPQTSARTVETGPFDHLIDPEEIAPRLTIGDKIGMGLKDSVSPFAMLGWIGSATYSEAFNRSPNYGQSGKDYAQRLGAAAARASSESIFSTSVMAPIFREDPRYFVEGPRYSTVHRALYAVSRVVVTRSDDGRSRVNYALLSGNAIGAGLTQTYYPAGDRNLQGTMTTFGTSLAGSGVKYLFEEFFYKEASIAQLKSKLKPKS